MKISINAKITRTASGGGAVFARNLKEYLERFGHTVYSDLNAADIDVILHVIPFPYIMGSAQYSYLDAFLYKLHHPNAIIVLRVNECDERKSTHYMNKLIAEASKYTDYIVYISSWLRRLFEIKNINAKIPAEVILNGADPKQFNTNDKADWNHIDKLKIVTHHWGGNFFKGHDIYQKLDRLLDTPYYRQHFEFTFIGQLPNNIQYRNTRILPPLSGWPLAEELKSHHIYLTASRNEPAGMHHIEGALCGLPLLYIDSGALPEYCNGYGVKFTPNNFKEKLEEMYATYDRHLKALKTYPYTAERTSAAYLQLFTRLYHSRKDIVTTKQNIHLLLAHLTIFLKKSVYRFRSLSILFNLRLCSLLAQHRK